MFRNQMPRYEVLSEEAMATLDKGWRRLMTEIGVEFMDDRALDLFRQAGQRVEDKTVFLDPDFVLEQAAKAPREFDLQARNPENSVHIGGDSMAFGAVYGPPFVREGDVRRDGTMDDFRNFSRLAQSFSVLDSAGGVVNEPNDTPLDSRHLDMTYALQTLTDKIYMGNVVSGVNAADTIAMTEILFGSREAIEETPAMISLINCNSPLRWDDRMLEAQFEYTSANQPVVLTPFILMGAMSPVTIPAALVQQIVEALSGIALSQLIRPGRSRGVRLVPVQHRHAVRVADVRHARVGHRAAVHRPDRAPLRAAVPHRRRADVLAGARRPGRLRGADDDAADVPGRRQLGDALGRLARGRAGRRASRSSSSTSSSSRCCSTSSRRWRSTRTSMAFGAHEEVGHGGHFLGAMHTMERFRTCFYRPFLNSSENYERWMRNGAKDTAVRAGRDLQEEARGVRAAAPRRRDP